MSIKSFKSISKIEIKKVVVSDFIFLKYFGISCISYVFYSSLCV